MQTLERFERIAATFVLAAALVALGACTTSSPGDRSSEPASEKQGAKEPSSVEQQSLEELASTLPNGANPLEGIVTSAQPAPADLERASDRIRTVLNLRPHDEEGARDEKAELQEFGIGYVHLPIGGADDLSRENVERFDEILERAERPLLVHCSSSNRVGALFALRAYWLREASQEEALATGRKAGLSALEDAVRQKMSAEQ